MRILITGLSSFTGAWFARQLAEEGLDVVGTLRRSEASYDPLSQMRIGMGRMAGVEVVEGVSYGSSALLSLVDRGFDIIGWHGADVGDYKNPNYDAIKAAHASTLGMSDICARAKAAGTRAILFTGTVAEPFGGLGDEVGRAASPYGLSKMISWSVVRHHAEQADLAVAKFIIPNPFGRYEQERFCTYLVRQWAAGLTPEVRTPAYVRDNIPIDKCARAYAAFVTSELRDGICRPSGYVGTQGDFTSRFAREVGTRLNLPTPFVLTPQTEFQEPFMRVNSQPGVAEWNETAFWDDLADYYAEHVLKVGTAH